MADYCRKFGHTHKLASALQMVGQSLRVLGRHGEAMNTLREAMAIAKDNKGKDVLLSLRYDLSLVYEQRGQPHQALFYVPKFVGLRPGGCFR